MVCWNGPCRGHRIIVQRDKTEDGRAGSWTETYSHMGASVPGP